MINKIIYYI